MSFKKIAKREMEVAFSKNAQPVWLRLVKYLVVGAALFFFWRSRIFWITLLVLCVIAIVVHFWYRHKTNGWTKSFGGWKYKDRPDSNNQ